MKKYVLKFIFQLYVMLPIEIIRLILQFSDNYKCHICHKKISSIDDYLKYNKYIFCSEECYNFS